MKIKQEQKPLEYFERMLPSYDEYVREKYPESIELEQGVSDQESKPVTLQQNDDMEVDIIGQGENKEPAPISDNVADAEVNKVQNPTSDNQAEILAKSPIKSQVDRQIEQLLGPESHATLQLPASFADFKSLAVSTQSQLLCTEPCDTMQVFELLQQYVKDTRYQGSFDELYEMARTISEENIRLYEDIKAQMIADELIRAGATAQNFYQIKTDSLAKAFLSARDIDLSLVPLIIKVEQKIGVETNYEKNLALVNAIQADVKNYGEKRVKQIR